MSEPVGRPTAAAAAAAAAAGGTRTSTVRRGFELYTPSSRGAAARRAVPTNGAPPAGGDGHDTSRGRALWEDEREAARLPRGEKDWKRDKWEEGDAEASARASPRVVGGGSGGGGRRRASTVTGDTSRGGGGRAGGAVDVDVDVPSGEQYEDISRKVEEEVVAKLARAQMMGMMLKAHREQEQAAGKRRGGGAGASGGSRRARGGGAADAAGPRQVLSRHTDTGRAVTGGGGGGGRSRSGHAADSVGASTRGAVVVGRDARIASSRGQHGGEPAKAAERAPAAGAKGQQGTSGTVGRGGVAGGGAPQPAGVLKVSLEELAAVGTPAPPLDGAVALPEDLGANPDGMSVDEAYALVGKIERQHKAVLEDLRRESGLVVVGRPGAGEVVSGSAAVVAAAAEASRGDPAPGAALFGRVSRLRCALSRALVSLVGRDAVLSLQKRLPNRLWMAHYRELEIVQQRLRQLGGGGGGGGSGNGGRHKQQDQKQRRALRARLFFLIEEAEREIGGMVDSVERQIAAAEAAKAPPSHARDEGSRADNAEPHAASEEVRESGGVDSAGGGQAGSDGDSEDDDEDISKEDRGRRQALQVFLTSLGDLARYRGLHGDSAGGGNGGNWARAQELYLRALRVDPSSGKVGGNA